MTITIRVPRLRSLALILVGALVGATLVAPVAAQVNDPGSQPAVIYTRTASCAGLSFYPADNSTDYFNSGPLRYRQAQFGPGIFRCDPGLPNGAVVTKVQFTLFDSIATCCYGVYNCALIRSALTVAAAADRRFDKLAVVPQTIGAPGTVRLTDSSINYATVDNSKYGYWLECALDFFGTGDGIGLLGADVVYTIGAANG
jgi:hypothetical protein